MYHTSPPFRFQKLIIIVWSTCVQKVHSLFPTVSEMTGPLERCMLGVYPQRVI